MKLNEKLFKKGALKSTKLAFFAYFRQFLKTQYNANV